MSLFSRLKTRIAGANIVGSDDDADFDNIINNLKPDTIEDDSVDIATMQASADPYPGGAESLATSMREELKRLRYVIKQLTQTAQWYIHPDLVTKTAAYTATLNDKVILCDATTAAFTITLPTAVGNTDKVFIIKKIDVSANAITVDGNAAETIDGALTIVLSLQYDTLFIISNNVNWFILRPGRPMLPAAVAYEDEANAFTALNQFKDIELDDQDVTPVADRRIRTIDGLIRATDTANVEGRNISRLSLEQITTAEINAAAGILGSQLAANAITLSKINTALGVTSFTVATNITLNDASFSPSLSSDGATASWTVRAFFNITDPGTAVARMRLEPGDGNCTVRWKYVTASDQPTIWVSYDATGKILAIWMADDPIDMNNTIPGVVAEVGGVKQTSIIIPRADLRILADLPEIPKTIRNIGRGKASSPDREPYRILWEAFNNPAEEVINRCRINISSKKLAL